MTARLSDEFVSLYAERERSGDHPLERSFNGLGYVVFKRTYARRVPGEDRTEEWYECVRRVVEGAGEIVGDYTDIELARLFDYIWTLRALPSGRSLWQLGTRSQERLGGDSLVNCWFVQLRSVGDFTWMFDKLMLGGGVGFDVRFGSDLGIVRGGTVTHVEEGEHFLVPDSREGWALLLGEVLKTVIGGGNLAYSTREVRPAGAPIKGFGGIASGPGILVEGIEKIVKVVNGAIGRTLNSVEILDIANLVGAIVVSGNVRRSAQIAIGDQDDLAFLSSKTWDLGIPAHRAMSNNSVFLSDFDQLGATFWRGYEGGGEPFGLVNVERARTDGRLGERDRPDPSVEGFNPCGEIGLGHRESCNLAELVIPHFDNYEDLKDAAILLYRLQKRIAALSFLDEESTEITHRNMRLGLSVTGVFQADRRQLDWLDRLYRDVRAEDRAYSAQNGFPESIRLTTVQPSGTKSLLAGVTPGAHPGFSRFHIRRVRMAANDPVFDYVKARGYPWEYLRDFDGTEQRGTVVVEFPCEFPYGTPTAHTVTWKDMLKMQEFLQTVWADNAVSITVYYEPNDLPEIREYMAANWTKFKSVSFLPRNDHGFDQAPLEGISIPEYEGRLADLDLKAKVEIHGDETMVLLDSDCEGGSCPIR